MADSHTKSDAPLAAEVIVADGDGDAAIPPIEPSVVDPDPILARDRAAEADGSEISADDGAETSEAMAAAEAADEAEGARGSLVRYDPLQRYMMEARRYPLLSREEEKELAIRYLETGDVDAAYGLVTANLRLVVMVAREYAKASRNILDLVQEGNIGLMEAVKRFDPYRGVRFPSYAVWWVRAYIIRYLINNWRMVKVGTTQAQRKLFFNLQKEKEKLEAQGIFPEPRLIAKRLDVKEREVVEMDQRLSSRDLSVDAPMRNEDGGNLLDILPNRAADTEKDYADAEFQARISSVIHEFGETLADKEARIFEARLVASEPLTLQEIGEEYQISRERVRQIEARVKKKLKAYMLERLEDIEDSV